jgi:hypothetical protein
MKDVKASHYQLLLLALWLANVGKVATWSVWWVCFPTFFEITVVVIAASVSAYKKTKARRKWDEMIDKAEAARKAASAKETEEE